VQGKWGLSRELNPGPLAP